jgi:hypothetical protein
MSIELEWQQVFKRTTCPVCKAKPGERCRGEYAAMLPNHPERIELWRKVEAQMKPKTDRWNTIGHAGSE